MHVENSFYIQRFRGDWRNFHSFSARNSAQEIFLGKVLKSFVKSLFSGQVRAIQDFSESEKWRFFGKFFNFVGKLVDFPSLGTIYMRVIRSGTLLTLALSFLLTSQTSNRTCSTTIEATASSHYSNWIGVIVESIFLYEWLRRPHSFVIARHYERRRYNTWIWTHNRRYITKTRVQPFFDCKIITMYSQPWSMQTSNFL